MAESQPAAKRLRVDLAERGSNTFTFFNAWFCPFAQRAWIALEHCGIAYKSIEALKLVGNAYQKDPRLLAANPAGLVPTLLAPPCDSTMKDEAPKTVCESLVCVQFIHDLVIAGDPEAPSTRRLLSPDPFFRAHERRIADIINREVCSSFYDILVRKDTNVRRKAWDKLVGGLQRFGKEKKAGGPCFAGTQTLGLVDVALIPHAARLYILSHYRGKDFTLNPKDPSLAPFFTWNRHVMALPAVKATMADKDRLLQSYKRYADGTAASKIADAVRAGKSADQHD